MKERLEQFINTNRSAFDDAPPPPQIWEEVQQNLAAKKRKAKIIQLRRRVAGVAAITITIIGTVIFLLAENAKLKNDLSASQQRLEQHQEHQEQIATDYHNEINQVTQLVALRQKQLTTIRAEYPSLYQSFTSDIGELNQEYEKLKEELKAVPEQDEVLDAMIQNLKLQAELLNEQLLIIQQLKSSKKNRNEKATPVI